MSYKILFYDEDNIRSHEINFLKKYGTFYNLLEDLVTSKITVDIANADQISFIINLMRGYKSNLFGEKTEMSVKKGKSWKKNASIRANKIILSTKTNPRKEIKSFPKNCKEGTLEDQRNILINSMRLYNGRNKIIKLFEDRNIKPTDYSYNAKSEELEEVKSESEPEFEESILERTKNEKTKKV